MDLREKRKTKIVVRRKRRKEPSEIGGRDFQHAEDDIEGLP